MKLPALTLNSLGQKWCHLQWKREIQCGESAHRQNCLICASCILVSPFRLFPHPPWKLANGDALANLWDRESRMLETPLFLALGWQVWRTQSLTSECRRYTTRPRPSRQTRTVYGPNHNNPLGSKAKHCWSVSYWVCLLFPYSNPSLLLGLRIEFRACSLSYTVSPFLSFLFWNRS